VPGAAPSLVEPAWSHRMVGLDDRHGRHRSSARSLGRLTQVAQVIDLAAAAISSPCHELERVEHRTVESDATSRDCPRGNVFQCMADDVRTVGAQRHPLAARLAWLCRDRMVMQPPTLLRRCWTLQ
jgi:hypothetical protein